MQQLEDGKEVMVECTFSTSHPELPGVDEWIEQLKKSVKPILSYGICAEFAKLVCKKGCDRELLSVIHAARRYSNGTVSLEKFEQTIAAAEIINTHNDYGGTIGMLIAAISRGDLTETINLVVFVMCYWLDKRLIEVQEEIMRVIAKVNRELKK